MYTHTLQPREKNTVEIIVALPWELIEEEYKTAFSTLQKELGVEGFRKGKVPESIAQKHLAKETVYQEVVRTLIPKIYAELVKKESLKPIASPKIELIEAKEKQVWRVKITLAQKPVIDLVPYKDAVKKAKTDIKTKDIWVPGKDSSSKVGEEKEKVKKEQELLNRILSNLLAAIKVEIADLIVEEELNHRLARLLDDIRKIGLTVDSYLKSKGQTMDQIKDRFKKEIEDTYKLEFILNEIADKEGIKVENQDLEKLFSSITDEKEKASARQNSYFYASVLRKQKTIDFLLAL